MNSLVSPAPVRQATDENAFLNDTFPQNHHLKRKLNLSDVRLSIYQNRSLLGTFGKHSPVASARLEESPV